MQGLELGDYIGMESCADMKPDVADVISSSAAAGTTLSRRLDNRVPPAPEKDYPPPIPLLARNENLPPHIPWVMTRHYTSDGRLVIVEERVRRHEYFEAHRSDGRLVINLVALEKSDDDGEGEEGFENVTAGADRGDPAVDEAVSECYVYNGMGVDACGGGGGGYEVAVAVAPVFNSAVHT